MRYRFTLICLLFYFISNTQEKIETDRPDQTETAVLISKNIFQVELGFNKENTKGDDYTLVHPTSLFKYGLSKRIELRLEITCHSEYIRPTSQSKTTTVLEPFVLGGKIALLEEKEWKPKTTFIGGISLPFLGSKQARTTNAAPAFRFTMQNTLSKTIGLGYNIGAEWDGETSTPIWIYTFAPGFSIGEKWYAYVEAFGFIRKNDSPDNNLDGGFAYFISNNVKADISGGIGLSENSIKNYIALGLSFRINFKKKN